MHVWRTKSTLDSLKSIFSPFRRKPSLGAPVELTVQRQLGYRTREIQEGMVACIGKGNKDISKLLHSKDK